MITYLDLQDASGNAIRLHGDGEPNRTVTDVQGLPGVTGFSGARDSTYSKPSAHGSITRSRWQKSGLVSIEGVVKSSDRDQLVEMLDEIRIPFLDSLDTPALLTWQRGVTGDGVELQAYARLTGDDVGIAPDGPYVARYQAHLRLDDPRGYGQALITATGGILAGSGGDTFTDVFADTFDPSAGGSASVNNTGTRPTPPVFKVYGYATEPQIVLVGTTKRIVLTGTIAAGDYVEVDVANRTVKLNGTSPAQGMVVSAATTWFELPRGASTIRLLAASNDAVTRVDTLYRPAFS